MSGFPPVFNTANLFLLIIKGNLQFTRDHVAGALAVVPTLETEQDMALCDL